MVSKLDIIPMKTIYFMIFHGFECTNFNNSNLSSLCVCFFFPRYFVKEYFKMSINLHTYHIFWVVVVTNFIVEDCVLDLKYHQNFIELYENCIFLINFHQFECTNFKNWNLCEYVSKFCDKIFVGEYFQVSIEWHVYQIFWIRGCK